MKMHGAAHYRSILLIFVLLLVMEKLIKVIVTSVCSLNNFITTGNYSLPSVVYDTRCNYMERFLEKTDAANYYLWILENRNDA